LLIHSVYHRFVLCYCILVDFEMTRNEISQLISEGVFCASSGKTELLETHISWILLCGQFVFKIKKPLAYSFLDFSTVEKRKYFCEREIELNSRLTSGIYLDVVPVIAVAGRISIGSTIHSEGETIDYAVRMKKIERNRQMDKMLLRNEVSETDIIKLAEKIALFHKSAKIIYRKDVLKIRQEFNDIEGENTNLAHELMIPAADIITRAIAASDTFIESHEWLFFSRLKAGFYRDVHGDLHSRNIFLLDEPQPFDCLEFNDEYRQIDVLNEVAFICMDLDAFGRQDLSSLFILNYNNFFPVMTTEAEDQLFIYYKAYRANVRAKVNSLRLRSSNETSRLTYLSEATKYLNLMDAYINQLTL
jgi:uncharacterized protein